jgi:hypothetical protein
MSARKRPATILVLDSELGFLFAISHELAQREISAFPARSVAEARDLIEHFPLQLDLLVLNCSYTGACGLAQELGKKNPALKVIAIAALGHTCGGCADLISAHFHDPDDREPKRISHCADVIEMLVRGRRSRAKRAGSKD